MNIRPFAVIMACAASCCVARAVESVNLLFTNAEGNSQWEETTQNWIDLATGEPSAYVSGANAYILEEFYQGDPITVILKKLKKNDEGKDTIFQFVLGDTIISNETKTVGISADGNTFYNYHTGEGNHGQSGGMSKYGNGRLEMRYHSQFNGDFHCHGGTVALYFSSGHPGDYRSALGSMIYPGRKIIFAPDEGMPDPTLEICSAYPFGGPGAGSAVSHYYTNTTIKLNTSNANVAFGKSVFHNCTFPEVKASVMYFPFDVSFTGTRPVTLTAAANYGGYAIFGRGGNWNNLRVDNLSGDDAVDLTFNLRLSSDCYNWSGNSEYVKFPNAFKKTGPGTIDFTNAGSTSTNAMWFREGKVIFTHGDGGWYANLNSVVGAIDGWDGRHSRIIVDNGAEIYFPRSGTVGWINNPMTWELSVSNATLRLGDKTYQQFGALRLHNATLDWQNAYQNSWIDYDFIGCSTKLVLSGDTPYDFQPKGLHPNNAYADNCTFRLGFTRASQRDDHPIAEANGDPASKYYKFTNMWQVVDFEVEDITKNSRVDARMGWTIKDMVNMSYTTINANETWQANPWKNWRFHGGIRKTGAGTFCVNGTNTYTYTTEVAEGALLVDGSIATSSGATVDAGAYLGGTGRTCAVTVKDEGGFIVDAGKARDDMLTIPSLTTEGKVVVRVTYDGDAAFEAFTRTRLLCLSEKPVSLDLSNWKVKVDGMNGNKGIVLGYDKTTGIVSLVRRNGFCMLVK